MEWGHLQSVIQLAAALNALFLSFREIRNQSIQREEDAWDRQTPLHTQVTDDTLLQDLLANRLNTKEIEDDYKKREPIIGLMCATSLIVNIVLLIVSSYFYSTKFEGIWAPFFVILIWSLGFIPVLWGVFENLRLVHKLDYRVKPRREKLDQRLVTHVSSKSRAAAARSFLANDVQGLWPGKKP